jgi:hypothetical protein
VDYKQKIQDPVFWYIGNHGSIYYYFFFLWAQNHITGHKIASSFVKTSFFPSGFGNNWGWWVLYKFK